MKYKIPPFDNAVGDQRLIDSRNQMRIEQRLNGVGRGSLLSSSQTAREEWVDALVSTRVPSSASVACTACSNSTQPFACHEGNEMLQSKYA
jgi:hypothetical protein